MTANSARREQESCLSPISQFEETGLVNKTTIIKHGCCDVDALTDSPLSFNFHPEPHYDDNRFCSSFQAMNICELDSPIKVNENRRVDDEREEDDNAFVLPRVLSAEEFDLKVCKRLEAVSDSLKKSAQRYQATIELLDETVKVCKLTEKKVNKT